MVFHLSNGISLRDDVILYVQRTADTYPIMYDTNYATGRYGTRQGAIIAPGLKLNKKFYFLLPHPLRSPADISIDIVLPCHPRKWGEIKVGVVYFEHFFMAPPFSDSDHRFDRVHPVMI